MSPSPVAKSPIKAVAARALVSSSTVSRVMNGNPTVDPVIAARVRAAARELNYSASPVARSLVLGRTQTVAILVPDLANPTFQNILRGVSRAAAKEGYRVLVAETIETVSEEAAYAVDLRRRCDAIILCAPRMPEDELLRVIPQLGPVVLINRDSALISAPIVTADYETGIQPLALHLHDLGHRRLAYLQGNPDSASDGYRIKGLATFVAQHPEVKLLTIGCGVTFEHGYDVAGRVVASGATGILAFNDLVAMGLLSALNERGVKVPGQLSITGFDDITFAGYTTPSLTTASVPAFELGQQAWKRLFSLLRGEAPDYNVNYRPRIEIRGSTGPVDGHDGAAGGLS